MPQALTTIQAGKLEKDVAGKGGYAEVRQHLSGTNFPVLVHEDHTQHKTVQAWEWGQGAGKSSRGGSRPPKGPQSSPHFHEVQKTTHANSFT